jgi:hypothetical protein
MVKISGTEYTKTELLKRVGDMSQLASVKAVEHGDGKEKGVRTLQFHTGSGLEFSVVVDRAMDIFDAKFCGTSLCWHSPTGATAPAYYDAHDLGWLWSMPGGLLVTCGMQHAGPPEEDELEERGLHGRVSNIPASSVSYGADWEGEEYMLWASGQVREGKPFGPNLLLRRTVHALMGQSRIWIKDIVENQGFEPAPLMMLYHCNMGFPLVDQDSELIGVMNTVTPRDKAASKGLQQFDRFNEPVTPYAEQVFFIDHDADENGVVNVALVNRKFRDNQGLGIALAYPKHQMPEYTEWKMMGEGTYVVGMEPGNCRPEGQNLARKRNALAMLQPRETALFQLEITILTDNNDIRLFESKLRGLDR